MALTHETTINATAVQGGLPTGYTAPTITLSLSSPRNVTGSYTVASSGLSHASVAATGLTAVVSALDTYVSATWIPDVLGLDVTGKTIDATIYITKILRGNDQGGGDAIFVTGTDNYEIDFQVYYEVS
jgi:hypothetical protein